jgi:SLT domain-containing protein
VANLAAAIRYIESRYGTIFRVQQANKNLPPRGYGHGGHVAMAHGGTITEPIMGVGASGRTYSFGENYQPERVVPNWQTDRSGGRAVSVNLTFSGPVGSQYELQNWLVGAFDDLKSRGRI